MLIDSKLILFGGKGGVGKTSMATATALYSASKGKKTLILSTDPAHSLGDSFEKEIGNKITKIEDNLDALEIDAGALLKEYKEKNGEIIKQIANEGTFFSKADIQEFFDLSLPGMDELMALIKIINILEEGKYDLLILDTAPTGHTIRLLEMPDLLTSYVRVLNEMRQKHRVVVKMLTRRYAKDSADEFIEKMNSDILKVKSTLKDSSKTKFIPVMIPEAMAIYETEKLVNVLQKHQIAIEEIIINRVIVENCDFCNSKFAEQKKYLSEIKKKFKYKLLEVLLFPNEVKGKNLEVLSKILFNEKYEIPKVKISGKGSKVKFNKLDVKSSIEFLLVGGKGGVGKTTMASAVALQESKKKKVLIFSTDPAHSLSDSFNIRIGNKVTRVNDNLDALEIDSFDLLNKLKLQYRKEINSFFKSIFTTKKSSRATIDAPYDRKVMEDLFELAPPGIDEIMAIKAMIDLMDENKYDLYILDTAPTGHAIRLLELPEIAESWVGTLLDIQDKYPVSFSMSDTLNEMLETIKKIRKLLLDSKKTEFISVAIPESMSLLETQDLIKSLKRLKIPTEYLIINKITPENDCDFCKIKRAEQNQYIEKFQDLKLKSVGVEMFDSEIRGMESLERLRNLLFSS